MGNPAVVQVQLYPVDDLAFLFFLFFPFTLFFLFRRMSTKVLLVPIPATPAVVSGQHTAKHDRATGCSAPAIVTTTTDIAVIAPYESHVTAAVAIVAMSNSIV